MSYEFDQSPSQPELNEGQLRALKISAETLNVLLTMTLSSKEPETEQVDELANPELDLSDEVTQVSPIMTESGLGRVWVTGYFANQDPAESLSEMESGLPPEYGGLPVHFRGYVNKQRPHGDGLIQHLDAFWMIDDTSVHKGGVVIVRQYLRKPRTSDQSWQQTNSSQQVMLDRSEGVGPRGLKSILTASEAEQLTEFLVDLELRRTGGTPDSPIDF